MNYFTECESRRVHDKGIVRLCDVLRVFFVLTAVYAICIDWNESRSVQNHTIRHHQPAGFRVNMQKKPLLPTYDIWLYNILFNPHISSTHQQ